MFRYKVTIYFKTRFTKNLFNIVVGYPKGFDKIFPWSLEVLYMLGPKFLDFFLFLGTKLDVIFSIFLINFFEILSDPNFLLLHYTVDDYFDWEWFVFSWI